MMRRWIYIIIILLTALSCSREKEQDQPSLSSADFPEGARVKVSFSLLGFEPTTKALGEGGELNSLSLAVFGGNGYLKEYVHATPERDGDYTYDTFDKNDQPVQRTVPKYKFTVELAMSDSPRTIHFLGNGPTFIPFGYDTAVMPNQLSYAGEMSYWQILDLPKGIRAKRNLQKQYIDIDGNVIPDGGTGYIADDETEALFQRIPLIRNWAKIVLTAEADSHFTPISFMAVNTPSRGTLAPYSASTGFLYHYEDMSFTALEASKYPGNLPIGTTFNSVIPPATAFKEPFGDGVAGAGDAVYMYERPAPSTNIPPSYVIIYGHYDNPDDQEHVDDYFYKVDLMEVSRDGDDFISNYYPIYRNFKYQINVKAILSPGHKSPQAAAMSAGSADVSADISTQQLGDISDGLGRLHVEPWMSHAFTSEHAQGNPVDLLRVWFGKASGEPYLDNDKVSAVIMPPDDGGDDILYNLTLYPADNTGWRRITFHNTKPGKTVRTQRIRITGFHTDGRLYREIPITLQPIQPMSVRCGKSSVPTLKGTPQTVSIDIPDGLVESMFPLVFTIEADRMTLTPDNTVSNNNLPVVYGASISENVYYSGKPAFQFNRTLTWQEYLELERFEDENERIWRSFTCYFKTNTEESASEVWVYNEFFEKGTDFFTHYNYRQFYNLRFTVPIPSEADVTLPLSFEMVDDPSIEGYPTVLLRPSGLRLDLVPGFITAGPDPGTYYVKPTSKDVTLNFISTTSNPDEIEVGLSAEGYDSGYVRPYYFSQMRFFNAYGPKTGGSNVIFGHVNHQKKRLLFGYLEDEASLNVPITIESFTGLKVNAITNGFPSPFPGVGKKWQPTGPLSSSGDPRYHELDLIPTDDNYQNVGLTISAPGYITKTVTAGRFNGNIRAIIDQKPGSKLSPNVLTTDYSDSEGSSVVAKCRVTASAISDFKSGDYIEFAPGQTYTLTVTNLLPARMDIAYIRLEFSSYSFTPASITSNVGTVFKYGGSAVQYIWDPDADGRGVQEVELYITPGGSPVRLSKFSYKAFEGDLYMDGIVQQ